VEESRFVSLKLRIYRELCFWCCELWKYGIELFFLLKWGGEGFIYINREGIKKPAK